MVRLYRPPPVGRPCLAGPALLLCTKACAARSAEGALARLLACGRCRRCTQQFDAFDACMDKAREAGGEGDEGKCQPLFDTFRSCFHSKMKFAELMKAATK